MRGTLIGLLLLFTACGGLQSRNDGGETGGGSAGGAAGGSSAGGGGTAGGSGGTGGGSTAGGSGGGSAGGIGGEPKPWRYSSLAVPDNGSLVAGISGRSGEIYAVTDNNANALLRSTGGAFTEVGADLITGKGVYVASDGAVFPVGTRSLGSCLSACSVGTSYTFQTVTDPVYAVCGDSSSSNVYAVLADLSSMVGSLWKWSGTTWTKIVSNIGVIQPRSCVVQADGTVVIPGGKSVALYKNGSTTIELAATNPPLTAQEVDGQQWYGVAAIGTKLFTVGYYHRISVRGPMGWLTTTFGLMTASLYAVGGPSETQVFAGGFQQTNGSTLRLFDGQMWSPVPSLPTLITVRTIYVAGPNEVWFGGNATGNAPGIDRAVR